VAAPAKSSPSDSEPSVAALAARAPQKSGAEQAVETTERVPTEAELLFQARKALTSDAALALRTVTEHEARYPKGRLTPEREVLAIEALRQLDRTAEAEARLQRFEARYPKSLHLKRLKQTN
jgi:outer membrane protein assembly factor BamD (BamD/ComL family)